MQMLIGANEGQRKAVLWYEDGVGMRPEFHLAS
jgi:hypothetical protein